MFVNVNFSNSNLLSIAEVSFLITSNRLDVKAIGEAMLCSLRIVIEGSSQLLNNDQIVIDES